MYNLEKNENASDNDSVNPEIDEVLNNPLSNFTTFGNVILLGFVLILIFLMWLIRYPDTLNASLIVASKDLHNTANAPIESKIFKVFVTEEQFVQQGDLLMYLESTSNHREVLELDSLSKKWIKELESNNLLNFSNLRIPEYPALGTLQKQYQEFKSIVLQSQTASINGLYSKKIAVLESEIEAVGRLNKNVQEQVGLLNKELELAEEDLKMQSDLNTLGVVSKQDLRNTRGLVYNKKSAILRTMATIENNNITISGKNQEIIELNKTIADNRVLLLQAINTLISEIDLWKKKYIIVAPASGKITFLRHLQQNQRVVEGEKLVAIVDNTTPIYCEMLVGQYNIGGIKRNQQVIIKIDAYPFEEYGSVLGKIVYISDMPIDSSYLVRIEIPKSNLTSSKKKISLKNGMTGVGEIITRELRVIERIFFFIRKQNTYN